jgi:hypothetical protein
LINDSVGKGRERWFSLRGAEPDCRRGFTMPSHEPVNAMAVGSSAQHPSRTGAISVLTADLRCWAGESASGAQTTWAGAGNSGACRIDVPEMTPSDVAAAPPAALHCTEMSGKPSDSAS